MAMRDRELEPRDVEAYFQGLWDVLVLLGVQDGIHKSYDPLSIEGKVAWSYVFELKDGGRKHEFESLDQLMTDGLREAASEIAAMAEEEAGQKVFHLPSSEAQERPVDERLYVQDEGWPDTVCPLVKNSDGSLSVVVGINIIGSSDKMVVGSFCEMDGGVEVSIRPEYRTTVDAMQPTGTPGGSSDDVF